MHLSRLFLWSWMITLISLPAFAWQVTLKSGVQNKVSQIVVNNERSLQGVEVYLVWFDKDAEKPSKAFQSWTFAKGWQTALVPVQPEPLDVPALQSFEVTPLDEGKVCPKDHRCFLALVAVPPKADPVDDKQWLAASLLPMNLLAGKERMPGQQFFLPIQDNRANLATDTATTGANGASVDKDTAESAVAAPSAEGTSSAAPTTEKPDIFRLVGNELLYANGQAQRFQIIDLTEVSKPRLSAWTALQGSPRELYVIGDAYILLQTDYGDDKGTHLTVLRKAADGTLTTVQDIALSGTFIESRRRGDFIYSVMQMQQPMMIEPAAATAEMSICADCGVSLSGLEVTVFRVSAGGQLEQVDREKMTGYSPVIAIFPDTLVVASNDPQDWITTQVQAFDLSKDNDPIVALPTIRVPGRVPSEFHLSVKNQQLRVVYGPSDRKAGSTLAIYDLTQAQPTVIGKIGAIAPGEDLFATRFTDDRAYVVTYERKDPLWVIDLTDPSAPKILGELKVPGWSEKLFFNRDRLFAVGIDDQPLPTEGSKWVRRVALSLFDVSNPQNPTLLSKLTPLAGQVSYSYSLALDDERALLLDWDNSLAALPIESWESETGSSLQIVSLTPSQIKDDGLLSSPIPLQRSLVLAPNILAALGDQAVLTLSFGNGNKPQVLGELELATNIAWLEKQGDILWAGGMSNKGYHRFYQYSVQDIQTPAKHWSLPRSYGGILLDDSLAVFFDYNPLAIQALSLSTGELFPPHQLEKAATTTNPEGTTVVEEPAMWFDRSQPMLKKGWLHVGEQQYLKTNDASIKSAPFVIPEEYYYQTQWQLRSWNLLSGSLDAIVRTIPGRPLAMTAEGNLITQEFNENGKMSLNLLALESSNARLLSTYAVPCEGYPNTTWADTVLYITCSPNGVWYRPMLETAPAVDGKPQEEASSDGSTIKEPVTQVIQLNPTQSFVEQGRWEFNGYLNLQAATPEVVLVSTGYGGYYPMKGEVAGIAAATDMAIMPPYYQTGCDVYRLIPQAKPSLLKHFDKCPWSQDMVLTSNQLWNADGFAGISTISW